MNEEPLSNSTSLKMSFFEKALALILKKYTSKIYKIGYIEGANFKLQKEMKRIKNG